jgi:hypothetical protein
MQISDYKIIHRPADCVSAFRPISDAGPVQQMPNAGYLDLYDMFFGRWKCGGWA